MASTLTPKLQLCRGLAALGAALSCTLVALGQRAPPRVAESAALLAVASWLESLPERATGADGTMLTGAPPSPALVYSVQFTNVSRQLLDGVRITSPVPGAHRYVEGSASGPVDDVLFSIDGGHSFGAPGELLVVGADGESRPATAADYTHVRWLLDGALDSGASGFVRFAVVPR